MTNPFMPVTIKTHAKYAPSSMGRILKCVGSIGEGENDRDKSGTDAADEGQIGHDLFEQGMREGVLAETFIGRRLVPSDGANFVLEVDRHFARAVDMAIAYARDLSAALVDLGPNAPAPQILLEGRVSLAGFESLCSGTFDFASLRPYAMANQDFAFRLDLLDLKMGMLEVDAEANAQLMTYAVMILDTYDLWSKVGPIHLHIAQPRQFFGDKFKSVVVTTADLAVFRDTLVRTIEAIEGGAIGYVAGPHCRYCGRLGMCPASADMLENIVRAIHSDPAAMRSDVLGWVLDVRKTFESFIKRAESILKDRALRGEDIGRPLVMTRKHRQWRDPIAVRTEIAAAFGIVGLDVPTPAQLSDRFPKDDTVSDIISRFAYTPPGEPTVGTVGDKRTRYTRPTLESIWTQKTP